jgi:hypothetical protein
MEEMGEDYILFLTHSPFPIPHSPFPITKFYEKDVKFYLDN